MRLGVVGHGSRVSGMIKHQFRDVDPDLRVVGIVDPDEAGARARLAECDREDVVFYDSLDEMVRRARPDALAIGTRCGLHAEYASQAARYDLPLFLEKPVATSLEQAVTLERAFEDSRCQVVVSFPLRVSPLCALARQHVEEGAVGSPEHVLAVNYVPYGMVYFEGHYRNFASTRGLFIQKATHDFDYLSYLMGSRIVRVAAMASWGRLLGGKKEAGLVCSQCGEAADCLESPENRRRNHSGGSLKDHPCVFSVDCGSPESGMNEDSSSALLQFASGAQGVYTQVFYARRDAGARGATVSGYLGTVRFDWYANELYRVRHHSPFSDTVRAGGGMSHFGGDRELADNFVNLVRGRGASRTPIQAGLRSIYACLAAKESSETGRFVEVRQVGG
ncbi:MAG: Gfo/Idh/MocA family oxidoreductase [Armatimonadetes bacterium]|nr:Gfo/Idh/MocA family oxidoreductase [Armatimonadota bacterium]